VGVAISDLGVSASNLSLLAPGTPHRRFKKGGTNGTTAIGFWVSNHPFFGEKGVLYSSVSGEFSGWFESLPLEKRDPEIV
jgi:hypothetical protein